MGVARSRFAKEDQAGDDPALLLALYAPKCPEKLSEKVLSGDWNAHLTGTPEQNRGLSALFCDLVELYFGACRDFSDSFSRCSANFACIDFSEVGQLRRVGTHSWCGVVLESAPNYRYYPTKTFAKNSNR